MKIPGYQIGREVSVGDMARVFEAWHIEGGTAVAVQRLHAELLSEAEVREVFLQEIRKLIPLDHPGLVRIREAGVDAQGRVYIVQDSVSGVSTAEEVVRRGTIPEAEALRWAQSVAQALEYTWARLRLPHAHLHPGLIAIDASGHIRVSELGLSRLVARLTRPDVDNTPSAVRGPRHYLAPEQLDGRAAVDARTDICALGLVLYHWLTGRVPFSEHWNEEAAAYMKSGHLAPLRAVRPDISRETEALLASMTVRDQAQRYPGWELLLRDVAAIQGGRRPAYVPDEDSLVPVSTAPAPSTPSAPPSAPRAEAPAKPGVRRVVLSNAARQKLARVRPRRSGTGVARIFFLWLLLTGGILYGVHRFTGLTWQDLFPESASDRTHADRRLTEADLPQGTVAYRGSSARRDDRPAPRVARIDLPDAASDPAEALKTLNPLFLRGAQRFNEALELYHQYQESKEAGLLTRIERAVEAALRDFTSYQEANPGHREVTRHIEQCHGLIRYARQSRLTDHGLAGHTPERSQRRTPEAGAAGEPRLAAAWRVPPDSQDRAAGEDLLRLLGRRGSPGAATATPEPISLFPGIRYLSPAAEAGALFRQSLPEGVLIRHPGFPAASVTRYDLEGSFPEGWTQLRLFTDLAGQILAVQGIAEARAEPQLPRVLFSSHWNVYDLGSGQQKPAPDRLVAHRVRGAGSVIRIESELAEPGASAEGGIGQVVYRSVLYLSQPVVDLMLTRLASLR